MEKKTGVWFQKTNSLSEVMKDSRERRMMDSAGIRQKQDKLCVSATWVHISTSDE